MKRWKRIFAVMLVMCLFLQILPAAYAANIGGSCGKNLTWSFDAASGVLTISGSGEMADYKKTASGDYNGDGTVGGEIFDTDIPQTVSTAPWNKYSGSITAVVLPEGLTSVGDYAFYGCDKLTEVVLPAGVAALGQAAFGDCVALTDLTVQGNVTDAASDAFTGCDSLENVTIEAGVSTFDGDLLKGCSVQKLVVLDSRTELADFDSVSVDVIFGVGGSPAETTADQNGISFQLLTADANEIIRVEARADGAYSDTVPASGGFYARVELGKLEDSGNMLVAVATYGQGGKMLDLKLLKTEAANGLYVLETWVANTGNQVTKVKAFLLKDVKTMAPSAQAVEMTR